MAVDLHARATTQRDALAVVVTEIADSLAAARVDLTMRVADPEAVATADLATNVGAAQHVDVARARLGAAKATEDAIRVGLAAITNPADAQTFEDDLRDNLIEQANLRVEVRAATERKAGAEELVARVSDLLADAQAELAAAEAAVVWGKERQDHSSALIDRLNEAPLADAGTTAATTLASAEFTSADSRLSALLPTVLRNRAEARSSEAGSVADDAGQHAAVADQAIDGLNSTYHPSAASVDITRRTYQSAEDALTAYVQSTPGWLDQSPDILASVAAHPDLTTAQAAALNPADPTDFEDAITAESALVAALAQLTAAQRALDDAELGVLMEDATADTAAAQTALDDVVNNTVNPARAAYDAAAASTLDAWEVEVPPSLWLAVRDFVAVRDQLTAVADPDTLTDLIAALDSAEDSVGNALDIRDAAVRQRLQVRLHQSQRQSTAAAATATVQDRLIQYVRGDGPSGRTATEL